MAKFKRNKRSEDPARKKKQTKPGIGEEKEGGSQEATSHNRKNLHFCHI